MTRRLFGIYTELLARPYKLGLKFYDIEAGAHIIEIRSFSSYGDFACSLLELLSAGDTSFMTRVCDFDDKKFMASSHKTRRYVAERKDLLYIDSPHLTDRHSRQIGSFWVVTNIGRAEARSIASAAAAAKNAKRQSWSQLKV